MKKWIHVLAVVAIVGAAILGMTSTATEHAVDTNETVLTEAVERAKAFLNKKK